jgi:polysaccharide pyruvyl transferase WcaK-like protein
MTIRNIRRQLRYLRQIYFSRQTPTAAYVAGFNFHDNLGDEAVYDALEGIFRPLAFIDLPKEFKEPRYRRVLPRVKLSLLAGGTRIGGKSSLISKVQLMLQLSDRSVIFGSGVDDPEFWYQRYGDADRRQCFGVWKTMIPRFDYVGVRGPLSLEILRRFGCDKAEVIGDPVIHLAADQKPDSSAGGFGRLGLNAGNMYGGMWGTQEQADTEMIRFAALARKKGWTIVWFVLSPKDMATTRRIANESRTADELYPCYHDPGPFLEKMRRIDIFIGMKLHSTALATVAYVPSVMLEYQPKCMDYMASIGQQNALMRTDRMESEKLYEMAMELNTNRVRVIEEVFNGIQELKNKQKRTAGHIKNGVGL